jgi:hypothetical protein
MNKKQRFTPQEVCQYYTPKMHTVQNNMPLNRSKTLRKATKTHQAPTPSEKVIHTSSHSYPQFESYRRLTTCGQLFIVENKGSQNLGFLWKVPHHIE